MLQLVFAREKASVAAAKRDISVVLLVAIGAEEDIEFGFEVAVIGGSSAPDGGGVEGGVG